MTDENRHIEDNDYTEDSFDWRNGWVGKIPPRYVKVIDGISYVSWRNKLEAINLPKGRNITILKDGTRQFRKNGVLHRDGDEPASENRFEQQWWKNGKLHREGGPAIIRADGTEEWYLNGKLVDPE